MQQLESLSRQTYGDFRVLIRDDGSTDGTIDLIHEYARWDNRFALIESGENVGCAQSFGILMEHSDADLCFFCDQDDVWMQTKIEKFLNRYDQCDPEVPTLVHSDLTVVDENLQIIAPSMLRYRRVNPYREGAIGRLLVQNVVTGAASMINRTLRERTGTIPHAAIMHDWWLALVAGSIGRIEYIDETTVLYRQHKANVYGARRYPSLRNGPMNQISRIRQSIRETMDQAKALTELNDLDERCRSIFEAWGHFTLMPLHQRLKCLWRFRILKSGALRNMVFIPVVLLAR